MALQLGSRIASTEITDENGKCKITKIDKAVHNCGSTSVDGKIIFDRIKTIHGCDLHIENYSHCQTTLELKQTISTGSFIDESDLIIVHRGVKLCDDKELCCKVQNITSGIENEPPQLPLQRPRSSSVFRKDRVNSVLHVIVKSSSNKIVRFLVKIDDKKLDEKNTACNRQVEVEYPVNTRVFHLKRDLYKEKVISLPPEFQRIISGSKILNNNFMIGDYLLKSNKNEMKRKSKIQKRETPSSALPISLPVVFISPMISPKKELTISLTLVAFKRTELKFCFSIAKPISKINEVLSRQFGVPIYPLSISIFTIEGPSASNEGNSMVFPTILDGNKTLIDYGVTSSRESLKMKLFTVSVQQNKFCPSRNLDKTVSSMDQILSFINAYIFICTVQADYFLFDKVKPTKSLKNNAAIKIIDAKTQKRDFTLGNKNTVESFSCDQSTKMNSNSYSNRGVKPLVTSTAVTPRNTSHIKARKRPPDVEGQRQTSTSSMFKGMRKGFLGGSSRKTSFKIQKKSIDGRGTDSSSHTTQQK